MKKPKTYRVVYEHDGSMWYAHVVEIDGCHTQGRTIAQARERIREALGLFDDHADKATLTDDVKLPRNVATGLRKLRAQGAKQEALEKELREGQAQLARELTKRVGVSLRDAGELLGVSKQRVEQILKEAR